MSRLFVVSAVLASLAGCASNVTDPAHQARNDLPVPAALAAPLDPAAQPAPAPTAGAPVTVVEVEDFDDRTICRDVMRPGSRIVVGQSCYSLSGNDTRPPWQREVANHQLEAVLREQAELTRAARERDLEPQQPVLTRPR